MGRNKCTSIHISAVDAIHNLDRAGGGVNLAVGALYVNADNSQIKLITNFPEEKTPQSIATGGVVSPKWYSGKHILLNN